jgi:radical SAM superfamily enzyme YgiQ (UPF0313 family)
MQIVLLSPKGPLYRHRGGIFRKSLRAAPLTLTTLAALVPPELRPSVRIIDEGIEDVPDTLRADLVGMTVITGNAPRAYELSRRFRDQGIPVVLGGPHITLAPDDAQPHADAIVTGYAEKTWPALLRDFAAGRMKPRYDMAADFTLADPADLPFPRRDLLRKRAYTTTHTFEATRGCAHQCAFCVVPTAWGGGPYQKPVDHVIADIRQSGARRVLFYDLNLIANRRYARDLFTALIPLKVQWFGLATTLLDDELLELLPRSGCRGLLIGFESVNADALSGFDKSFNRPEDYGALVRKLHALGILINGTFVFGNDADTQASFDAAEDFVLSNAIDLPRFAILTPFPGTPLFRQVEAEGRLLTRDWSLFDGQHVVFQPRNMEPAELLAGHERVWRNVYSVRGIARRTGARLASRLSQAPLLLALNIGYRYYAHNLARFYTCQGGVA